MFGFSKKTPAPVEASAAQIEQAQQRQAAENYHIEYIRNVENKQEMFEIFSHAEDQFKYIAKQKNRKSKGALEALQQVKTAWFRIDITVATDEQCLKMFQILGQVTNTANVYEQQFIASPDTAYVGGYANGRSYTSMRSWLSDIHKSITAIEMSQRTSKYAPLATPSITALTAASPLLFPTYLHLSNDAVKVEIRELEELWILVHGKDSNLIEDEYFIEQVANSYLPDAFKIYETFQRSTAELRNAADANLIEQVRLLRMELQRIYDIHSSKNLAMMNTQLDFLRNRIKTAETSELQLEIQHA